MPGWLTLAAGREGSGNDPLLLARFSGARSAMQRLEPLADTNYRDSERPLTDSTRRSTD
jgi:hypothetical protein